MRQISHNELKVGDIVRLKAVSLYHTQLEGILVRVVAIDGEYAIIELCDKLRNLLETKLEINITNYAYTIPEGEYRKLLGIDEWEDIINDPV